MNDSKQAREHLHSGRQLRPGTVGRTPTSPYSNRVNASRLVAVLAILGLIVLAAFTIRDRRTRSSALLTGAAAESPAALRSELFDVIRALPGLAVVLGPDEGVVYASRDTIRLSIVRRGSLVFDEIAAAARQSRQRTAVVERELSLRRPPLRKGVIDLRVRAIPMQEGQVLLLIDDLTEEHRVATVRRDFIANVSHELKTPVGAISLLAEAMMSASDDPVAVQRFAGRLHTEAGRLANLINDVIDLSRLQGEDPMTDAQPVEVDLIVTDAVDQVRAAADAKHIELLIGGTRGLRVTGMREQLVTALRNLLSNAIAYSPEQTRVAVGVRLREGTVEIAVKDQGIGIAETELGRIFERFYRVDAARSRATGGTGLGLAIVRNICRNHGGDVVVWSVVDEGSTFTVQLPQYLPEAPVSGDQHPMAERSHR